MEMSLLASTEPVKAAVATFMWAKGTGPTASKRHMAIRFVGGFVFSFCPVADG